MSDKELIKVHVVSVDDKPLPARCWIGEFGNTCAMVEADPKTGMAFLETDSVTDNMILRVRLATPEITYTPQEYTLEELNYKRDKVIEVVLLEDEFVHRMKKSGGLVDFLTRLLKLYKDEK